MDFGTEPCHRRHVVCVLTRHEEDRTGDGFAASACPVDNEGVPFTLAHAAAALPLRRTRLVPSALVIGTFAPDFEYFIRLSSGGGFGHTILGALVFILPVSLVVLWLFHSVVKVPVVSLLPDGMQRRLIPYLGKFRFFPGARFALIVASLLLGIATHILWDSFTHARTWLFHHWSYLSQPMYLPVVGPLAHYKVFGHVSTVFGTLIVLAWLARWFQTAPPSNESPCMRLSLARKLAIISFGIAIATLGALIRVLPEYETHTGPLQWRIYFGQAICTWIAVAWWQLVAFGLLAARRTSLVSGPALAHGNPTRKSS
jgi:membrane-bound metal-dependent hydrolase YbcI (DUF457 family)